MVYFDLNSFWVYFVSGLICIVDFILLLEHYWGLLERLMKRSLHGGFKFLVYIWLVVPISTMAIHKNKYISVRITIDSLCSRYALEILNNSPYCQVSCHSVHHLPLFAVGGGGGWTSCQFFKNGGGKAG